MNPRSGPTGPTCPKCGKAVKAEEHYRLRYGDVEHTSCDARPSPCPQWGNEACVWPRCNCKGAQ
jgi:hypothetical protein